MNPVYIQGSYCMHTWLSGCIYQCVNMLTPFLRNAQKPWKIHVDAGIYKISIPRYIYRYTHIYNFILNITCQRAVKPDIFAGDYIEILTAMRIHVYIQ